jgi:hypothetical protein
MGAVLGHLQSYLTRVFLLPAAVRDEEHESPQSAIEKKENEAAEGEDKKEETAGACTIYTCDPGGKDVDRIMTLCREVLAIPVSIRPLPLNSHDRPEKRSTSAKYSLVVVIGHGGRNGYTGKCYVRTGRSGSRLYAADWCFDEGIRPLIIFFSTCSGGFNCPMYRKSSDRLKRRKCSCVSCLENPWDFLFCEYNDLRVCSSASVDSPFLNCVCEVITAYPSHELTSIIHVVNRILSDTENQVSDSRMTLCEFKFKD